MKYSVAIGLLWSVFVCVTFVDGTTLPKNRPWIRVFDVSNHITPYNTGLQWQRRLLQEQIDKQDDGSESGMCGSVLLVQHSHVYTLGSATDPSTSGPFSIPNNDSTDEPLPFDIVNVDRGGQATYHGPGQLVVYPILDLHHFGKDIHQYLRRLEQTVMELLREYGIDSYLIPGLTGVWVRDSVSSKECKVAAVGVKISRWVTMHGTSINVHPDMRYFANIIPCGIKDKDVGSIAQFATASATAVGTRAVTVPDTAKTLLPILARTFEVECRLVDPQQLSLHVQ